MNMRRAIKQKVVVIILGLLFSLVLLEIGIRLTGFAFLSLQEYKNKRALEQKGTYRILCLGDSMTAGMYPKLLEENLNKKKAGMKFTVIDEGKFCATSGHIMATLNETLDRYDPDMVIVMMGCNDKGGLLPYGNIPVSEKVHFKTYKLARILWYHIINKAKEIGIFTVRKDHTRIFEELAKREENGYKEAIDIYYNEEGAYFETALSDNYSEKTKKNIELDSYDAGAYIDLGYHCRIYGKFDKAKEMFEKAIEISPENGRAYSEIGVCYLYQRKFDEAEEMFKKAIETDPKDTRLYLGLQWCYRVQEKFDKAEEMLKEAIEINPDSYLLYYTFAQCYRDRGEYDKVIEMLKKAIEINPKEIQSYLELGWCYMDQEKYGEAEETLKEAMQLEVKYDTIWEILALLYEKQGKEKSAEKYFKKANKKRLEEYNAVTSYNYQRLWRIVNQRGIKLVCMQYPMCSVKTLKRMLEPQEDIIFVDNEMVFKEAVKQTSYNEYFQDIFGGNFGHCTEKGNELLAENIADVLFKKYFKLFKGKSYIHKIDGKVDLKKN